MQLISLIVSLIFVFVPFLFVCVAQNDSVGSGMSDVTIINTVTIPSMILPSPTTILATPTTSAPTPTPISQAGYITSNRSEQFVGSSCSCDLLVGSCDPNCCCDIECSEELIRTFTDCVDHRDSQDDRSCISSDAIASSSLRSERIRGNSGDLFCVYQDNNPSRDEYAPIGLITSQAALQELLLVHSQPGDLLTTTDDDDQNDFYMVGDPILTTTGDRIDHMILPRPLNSGQCNHQSPVGFLQSDEVTCVHHMISQGGWCVADEAAIQVSSYTDLLVLKLPPLDSGTVPINTVCYSLNDDQIDCSMVAMVNINGSHCEGVLVKLEYHIFHNGTNGIMSVNATVIVDTVALTTDHIDQTFSVRYSQDGQPVLHRSGNRGYQFGLPILAGNVDQDMILLNADPSQWLRVADSNQNCQSAGSTLVLFGEDIDTSCDLIVTMTTDCSTLRTMTTDFFTQYRNQYIGSYGDSNPEDLSEWVNVIGYNESNPDVISDSTTSCVTVATTQQLVVLYGFTGSSTYPNVRIFGAQYSYLTEEVITQCSGLGCQGDRHITLTTHISFVEISEPPSTLLKSTTNIVRRLPDDFFYPFLNHAPSVNCHTYLVLLLAIVIGWNCC
ncbi:tectonic-1-like isoform X2 [Dysidea avara]|uniref:tectonic-1-like isoform X2 n=1 Tax=Dysidea avara TaxID=196820 RepID=UPI00332D2351